MLRFARTSRPWFVMAGRGDEASLRADVPAIHVHGAGSKYVDARHKAGNDGVEERCVTYQADPNAGRRPWRAKTYLVFFAASEGRAMPQGSYFSFGSGIRSSAAL